MRVLYLLSNRGDTRKCRLFFVCAPGGALLLGSESLQRTRQGVRVGEMGIREVLTAPRSPWQNPSSSIWSHNRPKKLISKGRADNCDPYQPKVSSPFKGFVRIVLLSSHLVPFLTFVETYWW